MKNVVFIILFSICFSYQDSVPNKTHYFLTPSAYSTGQGNIYIRSTQIFLISLGVGLTNNLSIEFGSTLIPGAENQMKKTSLKYSNLAIENLYIATGTTLFWVEDIGFGFIFITGTYGNKENHISIAFGPPCAIRDSEFEIADEALAMTVSGIIGGEGSIALITENWFGNWGRNDRWESGTFSLGVRFIGRQLTVDLGLATMLNERAGFPYFPMLDFSYYF